MTIIEKPKVEDYTVPAPTLPVVGVALGIGTLVCLIALFFAALSAFSKVTAEGWEAWFKALAIEGSMVVEAWALARAQRRRDYVLPTVGLLVALWVSGVYNYVQAQTQGALHGVTEGWQLWPLALGPLLGAITLSLNFGRELRAHEAEKTKWKAARQTWFDAKLTEWEAAERAAQERREQREEKRQKREEKRAAAGTATPQPATIGSAGGSATATTGTAMQNKAEFFRYMEGANGSGPKSAEALKKMGVPHTTAYRWWKAWEAQKNVQPIAKN